MNRLRWNFELLSRIGASHNVTVVPGLSLGVSDRFNVLKNSLSF